MTLVFHWVTLCSSREGHFYLRCFHAITIISPDKLLATERARASILLPWWAALRLCPGAIVADIA